jgi:xylose dehydrogenase (NAD/NADP)
MAQKIRWGILSTADIGRNRVIPAIRGSSNGQVYAVASRNLERAESFAAELNIPKAYGRYEDLIADPEVDAIYNPLPNHMHGEWSIRCAEADKPVLCEKPFAIDAAEAQAMVDVFAGRGILLAEAFMYRFHPRTQRVKEMVDAGAVGEVHFIRATFGFSIGSEDDIRLKKEMAGGALMDVGCYCINVIRLMTGEEPERVSAVARFGAKSGVDERLAGVLDFPSGVLGHFECSLRTHFDNSYEIRGTDGCIVVEEAFIPHKTSETVIRHWSGDEYEEITIPPVDQYRLMVEDFADALLNRRSPRFPPQDAVHNMQVIDRLFASARQ